MRKMFGFGLVALFLCALPGVSQAQLLKSYGKLGAWSVTLAKDPTGDEICVVSSRQPPNGPANFNLSFVVDSNYTRLFLGYQGQAMPTPEAVGLSTGGAALANLLVSAPQRDFSGNLHLIMINLPTGLLQNVIFPAMGSDGSITARAGAAAFSVQTGHFDEVIALIDSCARRERKDDLGE